MAQSAEEIVFDTIWLPDRLTQWRGEGDKRGVWQSMTMHSAIAAVTSRIELGHAVLRSAYRNPGLVARIAASIDEISGGRFILGIGSGTILVPPKGDNHAFGFPTDFLVSRFEEALHITLTLLRHGEVDFEGRFYAAHECTLQPRGPRPSGPPVPVSAPSDYG